MNDNIASRPPHPGAATVISIQTDTHNTRGDNNQYYQGHTDITWSPTTVTGLRLASEEFNLTRDIGLLTLMENVFDVVPISYLQWTTTGGSSSALAAAEFLMKEMRGRACRGTPWSGQAV